MNTVSPIHGQFESMMEQYYTIEYELMYPQSTCGFDLWQMMITNKHFLPILMLFHSHLIALERRRMWLQSDYQYEKEPNRQIPKCYPTHL